MTDKYWDIGIQVIDGCTPISTGCKNCWSAGMTHRFRDNLGLTDGPKFNGKIICNEKGIERIRKIPEGKTVSIWNDLFHKDVPFKFIYHAINVMAEKPDCQFFVLTKRAARLKGWVSEAKNIHFGVTCENQEQADLRIPWLLSAEVESRFLSIEPMLGPVSLSVSWLSVLIGDGPERMDGINYVIVGCETGPNARPCKIEWIRNVVQQCKDAGVKCFVKAIPVNGKPCRNIAKFPEDLRVRELI